MEVLFLHLQCSYFLFFPRTILLSNGIERIIRKAKENHETCKDAAADALRDLGLENYNL